MRWRSISAGGACAAALGLLIGATAPVQADDIRFIGRSRASAPLKRDILVAVVGYAKARHACGTLTTVETAPLPAGYEPKTPLFRASAPQHIYERWTAALCGSRRAFLVAMWPAAQGGADYQVVEVPAGTDP